MDSGTYSGTMSGNTTDSRNQYPGGQSYAPYGQSPGSTVPQYGQPSSAPVGSYSGYGTSPYNAQNSGFSGQQYPQAAGGDLEDLRNYQFSAEEKRVLQECRKESFLYRCVPLTMGFSALAHFGVKNGYLKPNPKYGSLVKVVGASLAGFILGKMSYFKECERKILREVPDSRLAYAIRRREGGRSSMPEFAGSGPDWAPQAPMEIPATTRYRYPAPAAPGAAGPVSSQYGFPQPPLAPMTQAPSGFNTDDYISNLDIDSEKNKFADVGLDDRPSTMEHEADRPLYGSHAAEPPKASYDDLRRQHRDAYARPHPPVRGPGGDRQEPHRPL